MIIDQLPALQTAGDNDEIVIEVGTTTYKIKKSDFLKGCIKANYNNTMAYTGNITSGGTISFDYNPTAKITVFRADSSATPVSVLLDQWDGITYLSRNDSLATVSVSGKSVTITNASAAYVNYIAEIFN